MKGRHRRDMKQKIEWALCDPVLQTALPRAMNSLRDRRRSAWSSPERFEKLRCQARAIKENAIAHLDDLVAEFSKKATAAGAVVHEAQDAAEACAYVAALARERNLRLAVKSKSMTAEEIRLNAALESAGVAVVEGDLGERIIQLSEERPSHLVVPAIHKSKEEIRRLLAEKLGEAELPEEPEGITRLMRERLRPVFLNAGLGITGANFGVAETGSLVFVENEGNISLTSQLLPVHVV
ncbi:MAG: lactate utilization protein, partial [Thermoleophilia bacterium]|nr:lactate utilization protein [Thermoleophilia bacterium]